jgi:hypothetical protein
MTTREMNYGNGGSMASSYSILVKLNVAIYFLQNDTNYEDVI